MSFVGQVLRGEADDHQDCQPDDRPTDPGEVRMEDGLVGASEHLATLWPPLCSDLAKVCGAPWI